MNKPCYIFDLDGTLTDPMVGITTCVQYALAAYDIHEPDIRNLTKFIGPPLITSFMEFYGVDEPTAQGMLLKYRERFSTVGMYEFIDAPAYLEPVLQWGSKQNSHWMNASPGFRRASIALGMASNDKSQESKAFAIKELHERYSGENWKEDKSQIFYNKVAPERVYRLIYTSDELSERSDIINAIDPYVKQMRYDFITGKQNIDNGWAAYIKELKGLNVDRLVEIINTAYDRMK